MSPERCGGSRFRALKDARIRSGHDARVGDGIAKRPGWLWKRNKPRQRMFLQEEIKQEAPMPYTRPIRRFYLTPPAVPTFVISVLLAVLAVLAVYGHIPQLHSIGGFTLLLIAYLVLLVGTLFR